MIKPTTMRKDAYHVQMRGSLILTLGILYTVPLHTCLDASFRHIRAGAPPEHPPLFCAPLFPARGEPVRPLLQQSLHGRFRLRIRVLLFGVSTFGSHTAPVLFPLSTARLQSSWHVLEDASRGTRRRCSLQGTLRLRSRNESRHVSCCQTAHIPTIV